jgi:natural product precursor
MKKLEKISLRDLKSEVRLISDEELKTLKGGDGPNSTITISDGCIENYNGYALYYPNNGGCTVFLSGVNVGGESLFQPSGSAYQFNGTIHVGSDYTSFNRKDLEHEYGHWIQESQMGSASYLWNVGIPSMATASNPNHLSEPYEVDATNLGSQYFSHY